MTEGRSELSSATSNQYNLSVTLTVHFCHNYFSAVSTAPSQFLLLLLRFSKAKCNNLYCHSFLCTTYCLLAFFFSKVHDDSNALRNLCFASAILSIHTHPHSLYILPPFYLSHLSVLCIQHNGSHTSQHSLVALNIL